MPKHRPPRENWGEIRQLIWERDKRKCIHCNTDVDLSNCNIDHIKSGKNANNNFKNLRTLCYKCHVLRADNKHRGMTSKALKDGIIPPNWRELVWED